MRLEGAGGVDRAPQHVRRLVELPVLVRGDEMEVGVGRVHGEPVGEVRDACDERPTTAALIVKVGHSIGGGDQAEVAVVAVDGRVVVHLLLEPPGARNVPLWALTNVEEQVGHQGRAGVQGADEGIQREEIDYLCVPCLWTCVNVIGRASGRDWTCVNVIGRASGRDWT